MLKMLTVSFVLMAALFGAPTVHADDAQILDKAWTLYNLGKYKQVIRMVEPLAVKGNPRAQYILGDCYENGLGVGESPEIACQWYVLAADQGYAKAMAKLGYAYNVGNGVPRDFQAAVQWLAAAAERGDAGAIETLDIWNREGRLN